MTKWQVVLVVVATVAVLAAWGWWSTPVESPADDVVAEAERILREAQR